MYHYYSNTNRSTLKTHRANEAIVGKYNNVLNILSKNGYNSHLISDNSYFLIDRVISQYDYSNINTTWMSYHKSGSVRGVEIQKDLSSVLDTLKSSRNFFFIEKTLPSHIIYKKSKSLGVEGERKRYLNRLKEANQWITNLVNRINDYDEEALIIIVADHGGQVGLEYTLESVNKRLNPQEALSTFSSMLSIKWPKSIEAEHINFKSNVNLFRQVFFLLSGNKEFLINLSDNSSYLPLRTNSTFNFYQYINDSGLPVFKELTE